MKKLYRVVQQGRMRGKTRGRSRYSRMYYIPGPALVRMADTDLLGVFELYYKEEKIAWRYGEAVYVEGERRHRIFHGILKRAGWIYNPYSYGLAFLRGHWVRVYSFRLSAPLVPS